MENAQPEPSMEEILASIRRIISEDEEEGPGAQGGAAADADKVGATAPNPASTPAGATAQKASENDGAKSHLETEDVEMIKKNVAAAVAEQTQDEILDQSTAEAASAAFTSLSQSVRISEGPGKTLEDIVIEMLQPMIKEWLDANLPAIVEEKVEDEVQRVARRRRA